MPLALDHMADHCKASRIREWVRVQCRPHDERENIARVAIIAGDPDGVTVDDSMGATVVFPVRRGDRRFFEVDRSLLILGCGGYGSSTLSAGMFMISESWLAQDPTPDLVVTRYGHFANTDPRTVAEVCGN